jgi:hypothetical protein
MIGDYNLDGLGLLYELQRLRAAVAGQHLVVGSNRPRENVEHEGVVVHAKHSGSAVGCGGVAGNNDDSSDCFITPSVGG